MKLYRTKVTFTSQTMKFHSGEPTTTNYLLSRTNSETSYLIHGSAWLTLDAVILIVCSIAGTVVCPSCIDKRTLCADNIIFVVGWDASSSRYSCYLQQ